MRMNCWASLREMIVNFGFYVFLSVFIFSCSKSDTDSAIEPNPFPIPGTPPAPVIPINPSMPNNGDDKSSGSIFGLSWNDGEVISDRRSDAKNPSALEVSNGDIVLVWEQNNKLYSSRLTAKSDQWSTPVEITPQLGEFSYDITKDPQGNLYLAWGGVENYNEGINKIGIKVMRNREEVWTDINSVTTIGRPNDVSIEVNRNGEGYIVWSSGGGVFASGFNEDNYSLSKQELLDGTWKNFGGVWKSAFVLKKLNDGSFLILGRGKGETLYIHKKNNATWGPATKIDGVEFVQGRVFPLGENKADFVILGYDEYGSLSLFHGEFDGAKIEKLNPIELEAYPFLEDPRFFDAVMDPTGALWVAAGMVEARTLVSMAYARYENGQWSQMKTIEDHGNLIKMTPDNQGNIFVANEADGWGGYIALDSKERVVEQRGQFICMKKSNGSCIKTDHNLEFIEFIKTAQRSVVIWSARANGSGNKVNIIASISK